MSIVTKLATPEITINECLINSNVVLINKCKTTLILGFYDWSIV